MGTEFLPQLDEGDIVIAAEEAATRAFGAGPGAVRFISGTYSAHLELERRLALFMRKDAALAETAALLVLKKKAQAIWGDEDDGTTPRSGR